ncbi:MULTISPECIES: enolase C-terminal domain-like protein [Sphingobacteriaceae]|uniref:L-alanine-DL-glutamate epimerase n=1 Tax=Sphingobacterium sp. (strain 21) TaxID=743722 RepID=F4C3L1_SPHS2
MEKDRTIQIIETDSAFEIEKLIRPFGFKGAYLTELWQIVTKLRASSSLESIGLSNQSILYGDADLFIKYGETKGNALMYALTNSTLNLIKETPFTHPISLQEKIFPDLISSGKSITNKADLHINFILNSYVGIDHAAWLLFAAEHGLETFDALIPAPYQSALSSKSDRLAVMFQIPYGMPLEQIKEAAQSGYFVFKIKTGYPGDQQTMLQHDQERLTQIHQALQAYRTPHTKDGKVLYTMDANGRYEKKETFLKYLQHAESIGAAKQILLYEEPLMESNEEDISDVPIRIGADESVHDEQGAIVAIQKGYRAIILKGIAKTLSMSIKIAKAAWEKGIPCACSDLTVNPILVDWHKNLACRVLPFPDIGMGLIETNGDVNYINWEKMCTYHPKNNANWTKIKQGVFYLNEDFYATSGGIFESAEHYSSLL